MRPVHLLLQEATPRSPQLQRGAADRPSFVAPLVLTVAGFSVGAGALFVGLLGTMGDCAGSAPSTPKPATDSAQAPPPAQCDRSISTPYIATAAVAGGVGILSGIWLVERLLARGAYNRELRQARYAQLHVLPTLGGAALFGRF